MKTTAFSIFLFFSYSAFANDSCMEKAVSDAAINECASQKFDRTEAALNSAYKKVLAGLTVLGKEAPEALDAKQYLVKAQRQWVLFRKTDCDVVYALNRDGTVRIPAFFACMTSRAEQRIKELHELDQ